MSQAEKEARQMIADQKAEKAAKDAYEKSLTNTPVAPKPEASAPKKMAKGGSASARADGCAMRGKTRGRMI